MTRYIPQPYSDDLQAIADQGTTEYARAILNLPDGLSICQYIAAVAENEAAQAVIGTGGLLFADGSVQLAAYSDEKAQNAVGSILQNSSTINFLYSDSPPEISASIPNGAVTNDLLASGIDVAKLSGVISSANLPSYVDDVVEYVNFAAFPPVGENSKIYIDTSTGRVYRWSGSIYVELNDTTAVWGSISGFLSNQTDLTAFLANTYTPQARAVSTGTGLTGGGDLSANRTLSLANTTVAAGAYGSDSQVASFTVDAQGRLTAAGNVSITGRLPVGGTAGQILSKIDGVNYNTEWIDNYAKEVVQYVKNSAHANLLKGQAVFISGADGTNPTISLAVASGESTSSKTLGFLKQDLANGEFGYVVTEGLLDGLNTNAATAEGDPIWLSPTVPGGVVYGLANKPYAPNHMVFLGYVIRKNTNNGRIYVKVQNGFELKELHDVLAQAPNNGDIIRYSSATGLWSAQAPPVGYTDENAQDAIGNILTNSPTIQFAYDDNTPSISASIPNGAITNSLLATGIDVAKLSGVISSANLPSYVDDVLEYANFAAFPATGEAGKIYVDLSTNRTYRWSGSAYVEITDTTAVWGSIGGSVSNQTDLTGFLASNYTPQTRTISAGTGLTGGGDLSANRTLSLADTAVAAGAYGSTNQVATFTVDAQGRLTAAGNATITPSSIGALGSLNGLTGSTQTFAVGTTGTDFNIVSSGAAHTFNIPDASVTAKGLVTTGSQAFTGDKTFTGIILPSNSTSPTIRAESQTGLAFTGNGTALDVWSSFYARWRFSNSQLLTWGNISFCPDFSFTHDSIFGREGVGQLYVRSGTTSQVFRLYNTFTDSSNHERLSLQFGTYSSARYAQIAAESAGTGTANINLVLSPKGTGALILGPPPDGTATGGNARGQYAIDLQSYRSTATQVASNYGVAIGTQCTVSGNAGSVGIGRNVNVADGLGGAVGIGQNVVVSGYRSVAIGPGANSTTDNVAIGLGTYANHNQALCLGVYATSRFVGPIQWMAYPFTLANGYGGITYFGGRQYTPAVIRTTNNIPVTLYDAVVTTSLDSRFRHLTGLVFIEFTIFAITAGRQLNKYTRKALIKDSSNIAGSASTLSILQIETVGTDIVEIADVSFSLTVDSATKKLIISVTGQAAYAVTGNASTDVFTAVGNNFENDDVVVFTSLTGGSGLSTNVSGAYFQGIYRVMNKSGNTFQLSIANNLTPTAVNFTTDLTSGTICRPIVWYTDDIKFTAASGGY